MSSEEVVGLKEQSSRAPTFMIGARRAHIANVAYLGPRFVVFLYAGVVHVLAAGGHPELLEELLEEFHRAAPLLGACSPLRSAYSRPPNGFEPLEAAGSCQRIGGCDEAATIADIRG